jgi:hypothetical protein
MLHKAARLKSVIRYYNRNGNYTWNRSLPGFRAPWLIEAWAHWSKQQIITGENKGSNHLYLRIDFSLSNQAILYWTLPPMPHHVTFHVFWGSKQKPLHEWQIQIHSFKIRISLVEAANLVLLLLPAKEKPIKPPNKIMEWPSLKMSMQFTNREINGKKSMQAA